MSRIGKLPIEIPAGVKVSIGTGNLVTVSGPLGELSQKIHPEIGVEQEGTTLKISRQTDEKQQKALHGLYRALLNNMVTGVSKGYQVKLELVGVGYRAEVLPNNVLDLVLGYSHHTLIQLPPEIKMEAKSEKRANPIITLSGTDKQLIGQVCAKIRSLRMPEPYKGKGIKFVNEVLRRKAGKAAGVK